MSDDATNGGARAFGERRGRGFFIRGLAQPHFYELMARECLVESPHECLAQSPFSDENDRLDWVGESAQVSALRAIKDGRGGN